MVDVEIAHYAIRASELCIGHSKENILNQLSFNIPRNQITLIIGLSGVGKTTLLKTLYGQNPIRSGKLTFLDEHNNPIDPKKGLQVYRRNLEYIIEVCKKRNIEIALSTYAHFLHSDIKDSKLHRKLREIIFKENEIMRDLSKLHELTIVDNANLIPSEEKYFLDSLHFTPEGMKLLAMNIAKSIQSYIN